MTTAPRLLREIDAAEYLGLSPKTLSRWRWCQKGPVARKLGGAVRYAVADLDAFAGLSSEASS
ncbi:MAG: helix-turn-helix domain-containing protein [Sphingomonas sp.]|uniref:helix-turn-helix transcriptional regulator n=1 Tax=Sphingomonas sp. TaxID=28214 RepID=UPI0017D7CF5D|nr:helix-turn-helix domain-containing protein [Sphingomonas sp.]MBA3666810.1 helix-turn-helix domain-containing protein [Sphingomonas sp.]